MRYELPVAARDALARLLMDALGDSGREASLESALAFARAVAGTRVEPDAASRPAACALAAAGLLCDEARSSPVCVDPPPAYRRVVAGWDACALARLRAYRQVLEVAPRGVDLTSRLRQAEVLFGRRLFFEVHEVLEPAWIAAVGDERRWLQGLIQAATAWYHWQKGNLRGAQALTSAAIEKLAGAPCAWREFSIATVRRAAGLWSSWLGAGARGVPPELPFTPSSKFSGDADA